jgi:hypothetical protein
MKDSEREAMECIIAICEAREFLVDDTDRDITTIKEIAERTLREDADD